MDFMIVTGMSGSGKTVAVNALEDIGYYCVDNIPPNLLGVFADLCAAADKSVDRVAIVMDARGGEMFRQLFDELVKLRQRGIPYRILFLDCSDATLIRRYKETRRRHPLMDETVTSLPQALEQERALLREARANADFVIDTSDLAVSALRARIGELFAGEDTQQMHIACMSFGFKYGIPPDADLVFDVRCLPNPFYIPELKPRTGLDPAVRDYVMRHDESQELLGRLCDLVDFLLPRYEQEGKRQLVIAFGCTGGQHRSVVFAEEMGSHLREQGTENTVLHRDAEK